MIIAKCTAVSISSLPLEHRKSLAPYINLDHGYQELEAGREYPVFAVEEQSKRGVLIYIHSIDGAYFPTPYPIDLFCIVEAGIPENWRIKFKSDGGRTSIARISFRDWADDDGFYERLIGEDEKALQAYHVARKTLSQLSNF